MLHNHLRNFTSHKLAIDFYASDKTDHRTNGLDKFRTGVEIRTHHRGGFVDACQTVSLRKCGGGCGNHKCRRDDELLSDVLIHKLFFFCAVQRVDSPFSGG